MAIDDYTHNIGAIEDDTKNQKADLKLSEKVSQDWINPMNEFHNALKDVYSSTTGLDKVPGAVGSLQSAHDTVNNLARAVTNSGGVQPALNDHMKYQEKLVELVTNAHKLLIKNG